MKILSFLIVLLSLNFYAMNGQANGISAVRGPQEDYKTIAKKKMGNRLGILGSSYSERESTVNIDKVQSWTGGNLTEAFEWLRDERFMTDSNGMKRRSTWLYPYDGCYARAELMSQRLVEKYFPRPSKIFIYGNLYADTPYGGARWWYHVVVGYRYQGEIYILDPALEAKRLLTLQEWSDKMGTSTKEYSVCDAFTFGPDNDCRSPQKMSFGSAEVWQANFFDYEWRNVQNMGLDPAAILGDLPPWLN